MTDLRKAAEMVAYEAPLHELLEGVPEDARLVIEDGYGARFIPVGRMCKEAAEALRQALAQPEQGNSSPNYPITESNTSLDKIVEQAIQGHASTRDAIRWAMQQEREACAKLCEGYDVFGPGTRERFADAIRARSEKPWVKTYCGGKPNHCTPEVTPDVTGEVTGEVGACVTCGAPKSEWLVDAVNMSQERVDETEKGEQKPVGYVTIENISSRAQVPSIKWFKKLTGGPLYTAPAKKEWVGLTDDDIHDAFNYVEMVKWLDFDRDRPEWCEAFARACEATLRHRNGEKQ